MSSTGQALVDVLAKMRKERARLDVAIEHVEAAVGLATGDRPLAIAGGGAAEGDPQPPSNGASPSKDAEPAPGTVCPDCGQDGFRNPQHMGAHRRHEHPGAAGRSKASPRSPRSTGGAVDLICPDCGSAEPTPGSLRIHRRREHGAS